MATSFLPKFADLVRVTCTTVGTGNLIPGPVVAGFVSFSAALSVGDRFYYSVAGVDKPAESEVGRGTLNADGSIAREAIGGTLTNFTSGQKTISLVVGAEWFRTAASGGGGSAAPVAPLFSEIGAGRFGTARRIDTAGRNGVGLAPATYVRDPDQTTLTTIGQGLVNALPSGEQTAATTAVRAILDRVRMRDLDGVWWVIDDDGQEVHAGHFGAVGDASNLYAAGTVSGTDNAAAIQALIDWRVYLKAGTSSSKKDIVLPPGDFRLGKGLQLSYGDTFRTVRMRGAGRGSGNGGGTTLWADFDSHPLIAVHNARQGRIEGMNLVSPMGRAWTYNKQFGSIEHVSMTSFGLDERDITHWNNPAQPNRSPLLRYNPHAAIAIDPYAGTAASAPVGWAASTGIALGEYRTANGKLFIARAVGTTAASGTGPNVVADRIADGTVRWAYVGPASQAVRYPDANPPAFLPAAQRITYGKGTGSSNVLIEDINIEGFAVGFVSFPSGADGNGDFLALRDCDFASCPIAVSIGQTQARNNDLYRVNFNTLHTVLDGLTHGKQNGRVAGVWTDCSGSSATQLFHIGCSGSRGQLEINGLYWEVLWRIGQFGTSGSDGAAITFNGGGLSFGTHSTAAGRRGVPMYLYGRDDGGDGAGGENMPVVLRDIDITDFAGVAVMRAVNNHFENVQFRAIDVGENAVSTAWRARALNTLAGGVVVPRHTFRRDHVIRYHAQNETSLGNQRITTTSGSFAASSRDYPVSLYTPSLSPAGGVGVEVIANPRRVATLAKESFANVALTGGTLSFDYVDANETTQNLLELKVGSVIYDDNQGFVFIVSARSAMSDRYRYSAVLQNGYSTTVGGTISLEQPFSASAGNFHFAGGGVFTPIYPLFGDLTTGSTTIANCQRGDGWAGFIANNAGCPVQPGDIIWINQMAEQGFLLSPGKKVTGLAAGAITIDGGPFATATRVRFPLWVRGL